MIIIFIINTVLRMENRFYSCYDELITMLFNINYEKYQKVTKYVKLYDCNNNYMTMTSHEIIIYSLLLHKCLINQSENQTISYTELQKLRNKRYSNKSLFDQYTLNAYNETFKSLSTKYVEYDLGDNREHKNITTRECRQSLLIINNVEILKNGNRIIDYSLGPFGKTIIESKRYSTLVPNSYFQINFKKIMSYEIAIYVCKILFIEKRKHSNYLIITLDSIMKNTNKYIKHGYTYKYSCSCFSYNGANKRRLEQYIINETKNLLLELLQNDTISSFKESNHNNSYKWIIEKNKLR